VTVSIGVATLAGRRSDQPLEAVAQQLLAAADGALYRAKQGGRNLVVVSGQA
jgi:PleD family two-component response regulator